MSSEDQAADGLEQISTSLDLGLVSSLEDHGPGDAVNVTDGLYAVAAAIRHGFKWLGNADASTPMGALEAHGLMIREAGEAIQGGLAEVAQALDRIADALEARERPPA